VKYRQTATLPIAAREFNGHGRPVQASGRTPVVQVAQVAQEHSTPKMLDRSHITEADIQDAKEQLDYARIDGDKLKIALYEASLNDLLDRYSCHTCHRSQTKGAA
jgi:hypothetical protein